MKLTPGDIEEGFIADFTFFHLKWGLHFEGFARVAQFVVLIPQTVGAKFLVAQLTSEKLLILCGMLFKEMFSQTTQPLKRLVFAFAITTQAKKSSILFFQWDIHFRSFDRNRSFSPELWPQFNTLVL
jgi:hypothetical protein